MSEQIVGHRSGRLVPLVEDGSQDDGLPWEQGWVQCTACGWLSISITHWPHRRDDLECPDCGAMAMTPDTEDAEELNRMACHVDNLSDVI